MNKRLLLVEQSATMRYVLEKYSELLGFTVDTCETYAQAQQSLTEQYKHFGAEYTGVLFGWPTTPQEDATEFAQQLESSDYKDLPVVVMSTDMRAETRAWVAGRDNTAVLPWKEYQGLEALLQRLIDVAPDNPGDAFSAKFDNSDVHLLVVDDSATIRYSLRDLFQMQGYKVTLAETQEEALRCAKESAFDIAILDFYLAETTGDVLCRELMADADAGDIVCTVLTGTYSDHIIKRSLRAGAVECMFKNESSELLLSRIDAISRFVRQQRILQSDQFLLEEVIDCMAGAVLIINDQGQVLYVNEAGLAELGLDSKEALIGQPAGGLLGGVALAEPGPDVHAGLWQTPDGRNVSVDYQHASMEPSGFSLVRFVRNALAIEPMRQVEKYEGLGAAELASLTVKELSFDPACEPMLVQFRRYLDDPDAESTRLSFFVMDVFVTNEEGEQVSLSSDQSLSERISRSLLTVFKRDNHAAVLQDNRYGFLLRHREEAQAYVLVRRLMQMCLKLGKVSAQESRDPAQVKTAALETEQVGSDARAAVSEIAGQAGSGGTAAAIAEAETADADPDSENTSHQPTFESVVSCSGSLLSITQNAHEPMGVLIRHTLRGMKLVADQGNSNQTILLDVRRMLGAFPS